MSRHDRPTASDVLARWLDRLDATFATTPAECFHKLDCVECGRVDDGEERGWTLRLDVDDDLAAFCPGCGRREFGDRL